MPSYETVLYAVTDGILTLTLNRPEVYNAFNERMKQEVQEALREAERDAAVRCVVIRGAGEKAFCSGQDLKENAGLERSLKESLQKSYNPMIRRIRTMEKPVVGMINGVAAGAGCSLALACDMRVASDRARFGQTFVRRGVHPDWGGIWFLPRLVGYSKAAELIFSGEVIDAQEAYRIGLVNKVVPHDELPRATKEFAMKFMKSAPIPVALAKKGLQNYSRIDLVQALDHEALAQTACWGSEDREEGMKSFLEKREPVFKGK